MILTKLSVHTIGIFPPFSLPQIAKKFFSEFSAEKTRKRPRNRDLGSIKIVIKGQPRISEPDLGLFTQHL